ncbi:ras-related protein Rab-44 isoform X3 [Anopheles moucheti]|uniref:ras-related protein Rab-44 isoform X3 n=2 Tax=Anopheles moucheti TaxID=186751 RepID=UPI0022F10A03|nr:ras-related protein Rab-44 isoform X3 [Anopheles moucheti]
MEQPPATRRLTRDESEDSPVEFVVVESDVSMSDAGLSSPEKKAKKKRSGLSFKKLRSNAQKLIPKRGRKDSSSKSSETSSLGGDSGMVSGGTDDLLPATPSPPPPASPTGTETSFDTVLKSTESLPAIKEDPVREAALLGARSDEDILLDGKDKQRQKKARKPSRAASFMKKLAGRSKSSKVAPNPEGSSVAGGASEGDEISSGTLETPLSIKRQTPEGAMFVSGAELYQDGDRDDGTSVDPPSPILVRQLDSEPTALRAKRTEMKITLTRSLAKPSTMETSLDGENTDVNGMRSNDGGMSNGLNVARNAAAENRELAIDSKPISSDIVSVPTPRVSIGIEQSPQLIAAVRTQQSSSSTSSVDARLSSLLSGDYIAEINKFSIENITNASAGLVAGGGGGAGGEGVAELPPLPQPRASLSIRERFFQQPVVTNESASNFDSQDVAPPSSVVVDEEIDGFMRKARGASSATGSGGSARSKGGSKSPATVDKPTAGAASGQQQDLSSSSASSSTSASKAASTVRTQEAAKPYQLGNSLKNPNNSGFKSIEQQQPVDQQQQQQPQDSVPVNVGVDNEGTSEKQQNKEQGDTIPTEPTIVFDIGTQVRPDRTSTIVKPAGGRSVATTLAVPTAGLESGAQSGTFASIGSTSRSLEELIGVGGGGSYDDNSQNNTSEGSLRRIAYVEQPTFYTPEEEELLTGKPPRSSSSLLSSALESGEYSLESEDYLESKMSPHGDLLLEKGASDQSATMATGQAEKREHLYKILVIGELGTGKTSFIKRYVHQFFSQNYRATIGVDFALKVLNWDQNTIIRLQLWDIAGQERFGNMTRVYYKEAVGAFIVFDVTRSATFDAVIKWKNDLDSKVQLPDGKPIPCILLANKSDQQKQGIVTTPAKLDEYVKEHGFAGWFETSAKENVNIEEAAKSLVNKILMNDKLLNTGEVIDSERFGLVGAKTDSSQKKSCSC